MFKIIKLIKKKYREFFPYRVLQARKFNWQLGIPLVRVFIKDLNIRPDDQHLLKTKLQFERLEYSIKKTGMIHPIIICEHKHYWDKWPENANKNKFLTVVGNQRVIYAKKKRYDIIEAYLVTSKVQRDKIMGKSYMYPDEYPKTPFDLRL